MTLSLYDYEKKLHLLAVKPTRLYLMISTPVKVNNMTVNAITVKTIKMRSKLW